MSRVDNTGGSGFTTDNGTGLVVRTKLNQIVAALSTLNQGSGDPSIGVAAYVPHIDGDTLKIRNAANNAFVSLGDVSATNFGHAGLSAANTFTSTNTFQDDVTFDGATAGRDVVFDRSDNALEFADNASAKFGTGGDLTLSHDGTDSTVANTTGELVVKGDTLKLKQNTADEVYLVATANGGVDLYHNNVKKLETESGGISLTGGAAANITALSDGATITIDMATACHHSVTLGGNRTFAAPSNQVVGQAGSIFITQDGTGSRTAAFNAAFKFVGGTAPTLTTTAAAVDRIDYVILSSNVIHCAVSLDVK
jgi:hypothetical protein